MPVETFTKQEFEAALPKHRETGEPLWQECGLVKGEYVYHVSFDHPQGHVIEVRSSVHANGTSAGCGEDSIRLLLLSSDNQLIASKHNRWVTRVKGWQDRLLEQLRFMARLGNRLHKCQCGCNQVTFKVKKAGPNQGRFFITCSDRDCDKTKFAFITDKEGALV